MVNKASGVFLRLVATLVCMAAVAFAAYAQGGVSVSMVLSDSSNGEPVGFATVSLTDTTTAKTYKFSMSAADGKVYILGVRNGVFLLKAEMMGYKTYSNIVKVSGKSVDLGTVRLEPDIQLLEAARVTAVGNQMIVKKDTVEYTASLFKTSDNDMLEELLKKLPGVEVDSDGTITANGETITKVMIDGKEFFLDDPQLATKNIPAKIIEKVKVVEKKSDQAEFTGIDDGDEETVIDLSIKPGMMDGWFGNAMAGGGHDIRQKGYYSAENPWYKDGWRYQGAMMAGRFGKKSQLSIILNANNTNNRGFNDVAGSMMQTMRGARGMGRGVGGWGRNGITTSWMAGANGAFDLLDGDMELIGNYLYNGSNRYVTEDSRKITYMDDDTNTIYDNRGENITNSQGHRFGVRLEHKFSENTSILFEPQFNFGHGNFSENSDFETYTKRQDGSETRDNYGFSDNTGFNTNWNASGFFLFRQRLGKPGRTISANIRYDFSNNDLDGFNQSYTHNDNPEEGETPEEIVNQRYDQESKSSSISGRIVYTEPLGGDFYLEANYSYSWNRSTSFKNTYDSSTNDGVENGYLNYNSQGETWNPYYSNSVVNDYQNHSAGMNFMYQKGKVRAQLGAAFRPTITDNETNGEKYESTVYNWSPQMMLSYDFNDNSNVRMFYFGRSSQPSTSQLMPVADNSDPRNVSFGNPYLEPYFNHNIRGMFRYTNKDTFTSIHTRVGGAMVQNGITNALWYDDDKVQYSLPLNGPVSGNADMRFSVSSPIARSQFSIFSMTNFRYSRSMSYVGRSQMGDAFTTMYYNETEGTMDYETFHRDFFEHSDPASRCLELLDYFQQSNTNSLSFTQRLRFTFRNDLVEIDLGGRTRMSKSWYSVTEYNQSATWNNKIDLSMNWTIPGGINLIADADYNWYNGYSQQQEDEFVLNAEISKLLFKDKFTLALKAYDILGQSKNLNVSDESNYHQETVNNTLGRYIILSLTYRFGNFNGNGQQRGPGGHGPMGPPPRR
ncbi:MAG: outer membrane beta-barrel protein [Bacteroidetes bacterium]|uniref:Outer membrane beta-barrel protein n=1 Tax=Candidatus Cryptobacteroides faecigallinarum TaxID=2840763 RepID=A0A9D9IKA1_9BACT|nr:outer membrane beta-barrel protein [Candidatus Cryptobacteroides faecigallinarum]